MVGGECGGQSQLGLCPDVSKAGWESAAGYTSGPSRPSHRSPGRTSDGGRQRRPLSPLGARRSPARIGRPHSDSKRGRHLSFHSGSPLARPTIAGGESKRRPSGCADHGRRRGGWRRLLHRTPMPAGIRRRGAVPCRRRFSPSGAVESRDRRRSNGAKISQSGRPD
ncbi:MAG: hypothetical protein BWY83_03163 [bacterium ADurb.Bin478]|nr:MAG: hypothetical protein BWY83_03163 [bacterium ADurb.Bin478]